jgi:hypothetical protein
VSRHTHGFANNFAPLLTQVEPIVILDPEFGPNDGQTRSRRPSYFPSQNESL